MIDQLEHTALARTVRGGVGQPAVRAIEPRELMLWIVAHHDQGWDVVDAEVGLDAETGLPWNLVRTPIPAVLRSGARGPALAESHHPFAGLLVSMHVFGLYCGRYGLSDKIFVNLVPAEHKPAVEALLADEQARQTRLRATLANDPKLAPFVDERALFHNYKLLQFFDTLALYFNCTHAAARGRSLFHNVPRRFGDEVSITVEPVGPAEYRVDPYPFCEPRLRFRCAGRRMTPLPAGTDVPRALSALPVEEESFTLVAP